MAEMDDQELFSSANADDQIPEVTEQPAETPAQETPQQDDRPRDEHGRFAPKQAEPEPTPEAPPQAAQEADGDVRIPPWRLREMREERDAINQRYLDTQRQLEMLQRQMPKPELPPPPDLFENPTGAIEYGAKQLLTPYEQRLQAMEAREQSRLEFYSRREAIRDHGPETVRAAYDWLARGIQSKDPDVVHAYNQVMQSEHPFDTAVQSYKRTSVMQQISQVGDLDKWVMQRAQELAGAQQQQQGRQPSSQQPQGSNIKLPPTLRSVPAARGAVEDDTDMSDAALFRHASR
jgi:hypothetical protein